MAAWKDSYYVRIYQLAREGAKDAQIARALGVTPATFVVWKKKKPAINKALYEARGKGPTHEQFGDYVYKRLSPALKEVWDKVVLLDRQPNGIQRIEAMLAENGTRVRQHLFVHALIHANFNMSEACRRVNVTKATFSSWVRDDPEFAALTDEIFWHRQNYCEGALFKLIRRGIPSAILFANETLNAQRGYARKTNLQVAGTVQHNHLHAPVNLDALDIPVELQERLLEAMRTKKVDTIDVPMLEGSSNERA